MFVVVVVVVIIIIIIIISIHMVITNGSYLLLIEGSVQGFFNGF